MAVSASLAPPQGLGAFVSLLGDLIGQGQPSGSKQFVPELPVDSPSPNPPRVPARSNGNTNSGEKNTGAGKKDQPKPTLALVQTAPETAPANVQPVMGWRPVTSPPVPQTTPILNSTPSDSTPSDSTLLVSMAPEVLEAGSFPRTTGSAVASSVPAAVVLAGPAARIAFGLRLTLPDPEPNMSKVSSVPEPDAPPVPDLKSATTLPRSAEDDRTSQQISAVHVNPDAPREVSSSSGQPVTDRGAPAQNQISNTDHMGSSQPNELDPSSSQESNEIPLDRQSTMPPEPRSIPAPNSFPAPSSSFAIASSSPPPSSKPDTHSVPASGTSGEGISRPTPKSSANGSGATPASSAHGANRQIAGPPPNTSEEDASEEDGATASRVPEAAWPSQGTNLLAADPQNIMTTRSSPLGPRWEAQNSRVENIEPEAASDNTAPGAAAGQASKLSNPGREQGVPPKSPQQRSDGESDQGAPAPKPELPPTGEKRLTVESQEDRGNATTAEPQAQPAQPESAGATQPAGTGKSEGGSPAATKVAIEPETNASPQAQPARQISLRLTGEDSARVDIEVFDRAGKVLVAVRTPDQDLAKSMQTGLGELVGRLENTGIKTEAWVPESSRHTVTAPEPSSSNSQDEPRHAGSGTPKQGRQWRQGQAKSNPRQQARWMAQVQETVSIEETGEQE